MGFFSFSNQKNLPWTDVNSVDQLHKLLASSTEKPVLLFKHSTRCSISSMALHSFENEWSSQNELCTLCFVDLIRFRDVSNEIAATTGIIHQSPQAILVKGDEVLYQASHSGIDARKIQHILEKA